MSGSSFGDAGHRSPYLSHAKRALYHLSYNHMIYNFRGSFCFSRSANKSLKFFLDGISCIRLQYSVVFWRKLINCSMSLTSEMRGIAPRTSGWLSRRSNIWPTSHVYQISRKFFSLSQQLWSFFSFAENWDYLQIVITIWWVAPVLEMPGIDPRTSRILCERSTIWATSPWFITVEEAFVSVGKQEVKIFLGRYFLYKTSIFSSFLKKIN